jgi:monoamine oxidase
LDREDPRTVVERGAEFVLDGYETMRKVAADLGLGFADMTMSYYVREPRDGAPTTAADIATCAAAVAAAAQKLPWGTPLNKLLVDVESSVDSAALAAFASRVAVTNASSESRLSAWAVADMSLAFEPKPSHRLAGGNQLLAEGLAEQLGSAVRLQTPVASVSCGENEVRLRSDHDEVVVDRAILAAPLAVTRELSFDPPLPDWKFQVWERAGIGHAAKLHVPLKSPTHATAVQSVPERFWTWTATDASGEVQPVLHCFSGSGQALSRLQVEAGPRTWADRVRALRPELDLDLARAMVTTWTDEPWSREAYTAFTVDVQQDDDELLRRPVGVLHFAGEHTAGAWAGLMEGALRSGERAASEVSP